LPQISTKEKPPLEKEGDISISHASGWDLTLDSLEFYKNKLLTKGKR